MPGAGLEPARGLTPPDFKSGASACSATPAPVRIAINVENREARSSMPHFNQKLK